jgi:hypothetical protein
MRFIPAEAVEAPERTNTTTDPFSADLALKFDLTTATTVVDAGHPFIETTSLPWNLLLCKDRLENILEIVLA